MLDELSAGVVFINGLSEQQTPEYQDGRSDIILNTDTPQGCVLSPLLYSPSHPTNTIDTCPDDVTVVLHVGRVLWGVRSAVSEELQ